MDIKKRIIESVEFGCHEGKNLANELANSPTAIKLFIVDFLEDDTRFRQRASWVMIALAQQHEKSILPYLSTFMEALSKDSEDSIKRNILRIFQYLTLPKQFHESLINLSFDILTDKEEPIAIQVFAMTVLQNLITDYPELERELALILEEKIPYASAGYKSRANKILSIYYKKNKR